MAFPNGTRVKISGLTGAVELNGKEATVVGKDENTGRITVDIDGGSGQKNLKADNLSKLASQAKQTPAGFFAAGTRVVISGLKGAPELNGKEGNVVSKDASSGRYTVNVDDVGDKNLKPENLSKVAKVTAPAAEKKPSFAPGAPKELQEEGFQVGDQVRVGGLNGAKDLNGKVGVIFGFDKNAGRYVLEFEGDGQKKINKTNMVPMHVSSGFLSAKARMMNGIC